VINSILDCFARNDDVRDFLDALYHEKMGMLHEKVGMYHEKMGMLHEK
jgi:hypothetical protein